MADVRPAASPGLPAAPSRPLPAVRAQAIAAAQRAFFDQALAAAPATTPPRPTAGASAAAAAPQSRRCASIPPRPLRNAR